MRRQLLNLLTVLSLLLCVAAVVLWVRSYFVSDEVAWVTEYVDARSGHVWNTDTELVRSSRGWWSEGDYRSQPDAVYAYEHQHQPDSVKRRRFNWSRTNDGLSTQFWVTRFGGQIPVPYWLTALAFSVLPWRMGLQRVRRSRARRRLEKIGLCPSCGYDLRATPERCPECGSLAGAGAGVAS